MVYRAMSPLEEGEVRPYREAWHLLRGESAKSGRVRSIQACAEECITDPFSVPGDLHEDRSHILLAGI